MKKAKSIEIVIDESMSENEKILAYLRKVEKNTDAIKKMLFLIFVVPLAVILSAGVLTGLGFSIRAIVMAIMY